MYPQSRQGQFKNTNLRLKTGLRAPTGYKGNKFQTKLNDYTPNMVARPITQHGMMGMKTAIGDPKRKILSRSYFVVLLKKKNEELTNEIARFREAADAHVQEKERYKQACRRREELFGEVKGLEGKLADYNLALDKHRAGTKSEDLMSIQRHIDYQNQRLKNQVDAVFTERKHFEEKIRSAEKGVSELKAFAEVKINELRPEEREEYRKLGLQARESEQGLKLKEQKLAEVDKRLLAKENQLRLDGHRVRYFGLKEESEKMNAKKATLEEKLADASLSFEEIRKKLMAKVKEDKKSIRGLERRAKEVRRLADQTEKKLRIVEGLLENDDQISDQQKQKYAILYEREKELDAFLSGFNDARSNKVGELNGLETANVRLLEGIVKNSNLIKHVPSAQEFEEMSKEYNYKKLQAENSEQTLKRVQTELLRRQDDLAKVDEIEQTLPERIEQLNGVLGNLKEELTLFENKEEERKKVEDKVASLKAKIRKIDGCLSGLKNSYEEEEGDYKRKLRELEKHPFFNKFVHLEKQLGQTNQLHFSLKNYIKTKNDECDFTKQIDEIEGLSGQINATLIK